VLHDAAALEPPADPVMDQVASALRARGDDVSTLSVGRSIEPIIAELTRIAPDLVFNLTESFRDISSLDSNVAALLNLLGLRYTGSSPSGLILAGDKSLAKKVLRFHDIITPEFAIVYRGATEHTGELRFPVIVKPAQQDASIGITESSVVDDVAGLLRIMDELHELYRAPAVVEELIPGREFYVGVLGNAHAEALPVIELRFQDSASNPHRIASFDVKWAADRDAETRSDFPTDLPAELSEKMQKIALETFHALRLRDYARIDMRVNDAGEAYVIEANPNPYLEQKSEFARAAERHGLGYEALVARIAELATARYAR
jgi:D-alanine-D-alanine ligase